MTAATHMDVLGNWNALDEAAAAREVLPCCGSEAWARELAARRPFQDAGALFTAADEIWWALPERAWQQAFDSHPRIGQQHARAATAESLAWSEQEQRAAMSPDERVKLALAEGNRRYEAAVWANLYRVCLGKGSDGDPRGPGSADEQHG